MRVRQVGAAGEVNSEILTQFKGEEDKQEQQQQGKYPWSVLIQHFSA